MALSSNIFSKLVGKTLLAVRENCITPRMINNSLAADLAQRGESVTVNFAGPIPARDVVPGATPPGSSNPANNSTTVTLDYWKEAPFTITDKDLMGLDDPNSYINQQITEAGRSIANAVDSSVLDLYKETPFYAGTAGTTPFATSTAVLQDAERWLITNLAPPGVGNRKLILDPFAHTNALGLPAFQNNQAWGDETIREGRITRALGYDWAWNQNMKTHTKGTATGTPLINGALAAGTTSLTTDGWTNSITGILKKGDIITIAGDPNPYVVTADVNSNGSGVATVPISNGKPNDTPGLIKAAADNAAITVINSHQVSMALHPLFATFASRPVDQLSFEGMPSASFRKAWMDPVSGLALTIKITEQHYQTEFSVSCLWAVKPMWTQFGVRVLG